MAAYRSAYAADDDWRLEPTPKDYAALGRLFERMALEGRIGETKPAELAIIIPTLNEAENVGPLVAAISEALSGARWEIIFVDDDSTDATRAAIAAMALQDRRIRVLHRVGRSGLSSAVIEGALATTAPFLAVMDADLQHDEKLLPRMLASLKSNETDLVIGSRYLQDGDAAALQGPRHAMSRFATIASRRAFKLDLTDPLSGFFMMRRSVFDAAAKRLSGHGYKILLDLAASLPTPVRTRELRYAFRPRFAGRSKLDALVIWDFVMLLADKLFGKFLPARFISYAFVGALGLWVHIGVLAFLHFSGALGFAWSQAIATVTAMTFNFFLNNMLTYRDRTLTTTPSLLLGLVSFYGVCAFGATANVGVANFLFEGEWTWWVAGVAGALVGVCWNFVMTGLITWRKA